ncbi:MAG: AMP-binding protein [Armatimonadota bacterium]|nr:AMP-binding protein [Armatimonadota bacterium]MDR7438466.1 AMP-binding protein [Armatimonadota bacterium]MDR7563163.1 AMP-binding protein [Armatimonadota bacterium]MDR7567154.1 AMP-binding protein [Armatimonadota bacterium]MDR7602306.1 AMP-binding protein [Armatimonadota bacterium]
MAVLKHPQVLTGTVPDRFLRAVRERAGRVALQHKRRGLWQPVTWEEYGRSAEEIARGLVALGLQRGEAAAIIGQNRPEWLFCDMGIQLAGGISVAVYTTSPPEQCAYVLGHSESRVFFVENEEQLDKALIIRSQLPHLRTIVVMDPEGLEGFADPQVMTLDELRALGRALGDAGVLEARLREVEEEDVAVLLYTSGTTGPPKAAMLTHRNLLWTAQALGAANPLYPTDTALSFLPLAHIAERMLSLYLPLVWGYTVHFAESLETLFQNLQEVRPTILFAVPRLWEKLYAQVELHMRAGGVDFLKRTAYRTAVHFGRRHALSRLAGQPIPASLRVAHALSEALVLRPLRRRLGLDRVRFAVSGAAPIAPEILEYYHAIGVPVREVYGQTEGSGPTTIHHGDRIRLGTVGQPLPGVEVRIAEDGEILVRGPNVFAGYFKDPEATAQALRDGWLHSGDVGEMDAEGFLRITDRKKDILINAYGKNIAPAYVENKLKASPYIHDAVVIGDRRPYLVALIVLDEDHVARWAQEHRIPFTTFADLSMNERVQELLEQEVQQVNRALSPPEQVKRFAILPKRLYEEDGEITPTLKVKRKVIAERYADLIESLYRS